MKVFHLSKRKILFQLVVLIGCVALGWALNVRLTPKAGGEHHNEVPYVITMDTVLETIAPQKKYIAVAEAVNGVDVKAQVTGYLDKVLFKEGAFVKKDDVLFVIEQSRYLEAVNRADAEVAHAKANLKEIENDHKRNKVLFEQKVLTASNIEASESTLEQAKAALKAAKANAETARISLGYTEIKSPINGYIGKALITKGNFIDMSGRPMARIVQVSPIRIAFSITDRDRLEAVKRLGTEGSFINNVKIALPDDSIVPVKVIDTFFDSEINPSTATVTAYIDVENDDNLLLPGNHVDVIVQTDKEKPLVLVPQSAVLQDNLGMFVYTVDKDSKAQKTYVKTGDLLDDKLVISEGLEQGARLIVQGLQKVQNGMAVKQSVVK